MKNFSEMNLMRISVYMGGILFSFLTGVGILSYNILNHIKFESPTYEKLFGILVCSIFALAFISLCFSILVPRILGKKLTPLIDHLANTSLDFELKSQEIYNENTRSENVTKLQLDEIKKTAGSLQQIQMTVEKNSQNVMNSKSLVLRSKKQAHDSQSAVYEMVKTINELSLNQDRITKEIELQNQDLSGIIKIINEINNKTKVINDIVFQTKLLSFNASVEAARAGEHGKGFSVVAQEIGNLAQMSGSSSQEISALLVASIKKVEEIVSQTTSRVEKLVSAGKVEIQKSSEQAANCDTLLTSLSEKVQNIAAAIEDIFLATHDQADKIGAINSSVQELEKSTESSFASSKSRNSQYQEYIENSKSMRQNVKSISQLFHFNVSNSFEPISNSVPKTPSTIIHKAPPTELKIKDAKKPVPKKELDKKPMAKVIPFKTELKKSVASSPKSQAIVVAKKTEAKGSVAKASGDQPNPITKIENKVPKSSDPRFEDV